MRALLVKVAGMFEILSRVCFKDVPFNN
jgi:hypothetical protein